jgi:hypothetical protein
MPQAYVFMEHLLSAFQFASCVHCFLLEVCIRRYTKEEREKIEMYRQYGYRNTILDHVMQYRNEFQDMHHLVLSNILKKNKEINVMLTALERRHIEEGDTFTCFLCQHTVRHVGNLSMCCEACKTTFPL